MFPNNRAVVLTKLSLSLNWIKSSRDVTELNVCRSWRSRAFGTWIGWIAKTFDYINRVTKHFAFGLRGYVDTLSPLIAMLLLDRSCVIVGIFFKYYVPQQWHPSQVYV